MPVAVTKPARKRGPPAPLNLQSSAAPVSEIVLEKEPVHVEVPAEPVPQQAAPPPRTTSKLRANRNVKSLALNLSSASNSQETSPASPSVPEALPQPRRQSVASLPGASVSAILHRTDEGDTPSAAYRDGPIEIMPLIWLGSEDNARDWETLIKRGIRSILNVAKEVASPFEQTNHRHQMRAISTPNLSEFPRSVGTYQPANLASGRPPMHYLKLPWSHGQSDLVRKGFPEAMAFVDEAMARNEGVLVHCQCGISRSATMVIALVMRAAAEAGSNTPPEVLALRGRGMQGAYHLVQQKSKSIGPNMSLIYQLLDYERALKGGNSPDASSMGASEDEEWERQRRLLDSPTEESSEVWKEARDLDREMEERRARKLSLASTGSNVSFTGAIGNGAPWKSRYTNPPFVRARAPSVESNLTSRSSISILSEDPVEEEEEEENAGAPSTDATDEDSHRFEGIKPLEPISAVPARLTAFKVQVVPPSAPATKRAFNLPPVPPSAPANKKVFPRMSRSSVPPSAPPTKQSFVLPRTPTTTIQENDSSPHKKEKRRPPPLKSVGQLGVIPSIQLVSTPSGSSRIPSTASVSSFASSRSSQASSQASSRRRSFRPLSFVPFPSKESLLNPDVPVPIGPTPSATQTLFVFPPSPSGNAMTPSTLTLTSTPMFTPGFGNSMTPRAGVFRQRKDSRKSYIQLSAVTPTIATARVDAKGFFGPV